MFEGIVFPAVNSRAGYAGRVPHIRVKQDNRPEGPCPALVGTGWVYAAASLAGDLCKEYAVFADGFFYYRGAVALASEEPLAELVER